MVPVSIFVYAWELRVAISPDPQEYENTSQALKQRTSLKGHGAVDDDKYDAVTKDFSVYMFKQAGADTL